MAAVASKTVGFEDEVSFADTPDVFGRGCRYAVGGGDDLKVTAGGDGSRSITVAAGKAWGDAVIAEHSTATVLNADENAGSAIRWDTLVERRDWATNTATLTLLAGGVSQTLAPAVQLRNPTPTTGAGFTYADQPIALIGVPVGAPTISEVNIIDLRVWSGEGGGLYARHLAARSYIGSPGTSVRIGDELHTRVLDSSGAPVWERADLFAIGQARFDATGTMTQGMIPRANLEPDETEWVSTSLSISGYSGLSWSRKVKNGWCALKLVGARSSGQITNVDSAFLTVPTNLRPAERVYGQATIGSNFFRAYIEGSGVLHVDPFTISAGQNFQVYITWPVG